MLFNTSVNGKSETRFLGETGNKPSGLFLTEQYKDAYKTGRMPILQPLNILGLTQQRQKD
jgi:hypothetical protein